MSIRVVAVVVDPTMLTLYKPDGSRLEIPQGDVRIPAVLEAMPTIEAQGYADIEFHVANPYKDFEELTKEAIRFFRIAKTVVTNILAAAEAATGIESDPETVPVVAPGSVGSVPGSRPEQRGQMVTEPASAPAQPVHVHVNVPDMKQRSAVQEIMAQAEPVSSEGFNPADTKDSETIVAVSGDEVITGAEQLASHLAHAKKVGSTIGMENFFRRINPVIKLRRHSVEDLLRFMEKNDLPIADDGSLIVYKVLNKRNGVYYDCHTGRVPQRIGSFVCVPDELVDLNRDRECSNGLHVARRGYIGGFSGDVCTIVKVAPEDVMTVPHRDPDKVRVKGYHILMELEHDAWQMLKRNTPMTSNPKAQKMLGRAVAGDHIGIIERVQINGQQGQNVVVTPVGKSAPVAKQSKTAVALDDESIKTPEEKIDAKAQGEAMAEVIKEKAKVSPRQQKAQDLMEIIETSKDPGQRFAAALDLIAHKRTAKVSWGALGLSDAQATKAMELSASEAPAPAPAPEPTPEPETPTTPGPNGRKQRLFDLNRIYSDTTNSYKLRSEAAQELLAIRKGAKKSWESLGYPELSDLSLQSFVDAGPPVIETSASAPVDAGPTKAQQARALFDAKDWAGLWAFKKAAKKSWQVLGFNDREEATILANKQ